MQRVERVNAGIRIYQATSGRMRLVRDAEGKNNLSKWEAHTLSQTSLFVLSSKRGIPKHSSRGTHSDTNLVMAGDMGGPELDSSGLSVSVPFCSGFDSVPPAVHT